MSTINALNKKADSLQASMTPRPKRERSLYHVFLDEQGQMLPGSEQVQQKADRAGINTKEYMGLPDDDGIEE